MKLNILPTLRCPCTVRQVACHGLLGLDEKHLDPLFHGDDQSELIEGVLQCRQCGTEYPVICGVLIVVPNLKSYMAERYLEITSATIPVGVSQHLADYLYKCGYELHTIGSKISSWDSALGIGNYIAAHYHPLAVERNPVIQALANSSTGDFYAELTGMVRPILAKGGHTLDIGCSVGGLCWRFAKVSHRVFGVDISFKAVLTARQILMSSPRPLTTYRLHREGWLYDDQTIAVDNPENVELLVASGLGLPFQTNSFDFVSCVNLLDIVSDPAKLLEELDRVSAQVNGSALLADPYYWRLDRSDSDAWIGTKEAMSSRQALRDRLSSRFRVLKEKDDLVWLHRVNSRYYQLWLEDVVVLERRRSPDLD